MAAVVPLAYIAPRVGSLVAIPYSLGANGWLEVFVIEVVPHVGSRLPEVLGAPYGAQIATFRSAEWRALGPVDVRCGVCYEVVPEGVLIADHAETSERHASIARVIGAAA